MTIRIDHLIWATPDLGAGVRQMEDLLREPLTEGGVHPNWGTKNYLGSLGRGVYLEVIGPDPEHEGPAPTLWGIGEMDGPRLMAWSATGVDLDELTRGARAAGVPLGAIREGGRATPDGRVLEWTLTDPGAVICDGVVPFFIDWGDTPHPAVTTTRVGELVELRVEHPDAELVRSTYEALGINGIGVATGSEVGLIASIRTSDGIVDVR